MIMLDKYNDKCMFHDMEIYVWINYGDNHKYSGTLFCIYVVER